MKVDATFYSKNVSLAKGYRNMGKAYCEVSNTTTNKENTAFRVNRGAQHKVEDSAGIEVCLSLSRGTRVFSVVSQLAGETG